MPALFEFVHSFLAGLRKRTREGCPEASFRIPIVALVSCDQDRDALTHIAARERWDLHLAESCEDAHFTASQLSAPVIVFDRDWPGAGWRNVVQNLASAAHQPCVILSTSVADEYLWQELIGCGGYDMLAKPLRAEDAARVIKLALSYWRAAVKRRVSRARPSMKYVWNAVADAETRVTRGPV